MGSISGFICMQYVITHMSHKHTVVVHTRRLVRL
jgi:hypothetical protein|tara:strand:- start:150 stop:251 length:102 start_codon:yes stop_codon:yes gene_type:complete